VKTCCNALFVIVASIDSTAAKISLVEKICLDRSTTTSTIKLSNMIACNPVRMVVELSQSFLTALPLTEEEVVVSTKNSEWVKLYECTLFNCITKLDQDGASL
jgi:hypothetical protein